MLAVTPKGALSIPVKEVLRGAPGYVGMATASQSPHTRGVGAKSLCRGLHWGHTHRLSLANSKTAAVGPRPSSFIGQRAALVQCYALGNYSFIWDDHLITWGPLHKRG